MDNRQIGQIKGVLFLLALVPAGLLLHALLFGDLGANPVETLSRQTGTWTLNFLWLTLLVSPLRAWTGLHWLLRLRRMLGLYCFFYACLHLACFVVLDHEGEVLAMARDVLKRPFVTVGFAAFCLLIPLAATSNAWAIRRLGGRRWQELHRNIYLISLLGLLHYFWLVKASALVYPLIYAVLLTVLLGWRVQERLRKATVVPPKPRAQPLTFYRQKPDQQGQ